MLSSFESSLLSPNYQLDKGEKLFQDNERRIINFAFFSSLTQRQIIDETKIPQQTVSRIVKSLFARDVLLQREREATGSRGQPGYRLETNPGYAYSVGIGILTDALSISVMDFEGKIVHNNQRLLADMTIKNVMNNLDELFQNIFTETDIPRDKILGIGVGISGFFTIDKEKVNTHSTLNEWADVNISHLLSDWFKLPVWVENDATAAAAGEGILGVGKRYNNFVYLFISADLGGGIITNGDIMHGTHGNAGEIGDILPPKIYTHPNLENLRQILIHNGVDISSISELIASFDINWPGVTEWVTKVKDAVSLIASSSAALLDTEAIVIGGHIPKPLAEMLIKDVVIYALFRRSSIRPRPELILAETHYEPVCVGAASLPFRSLCL
jgi:predicted NBD/HSP70 family sugar kinase